ncbi:MAG: ClbS/DfsB family four-helix bundle protein [Chloroflexi bacterium]|nr:ClbS/DfsB family four-helix bundle protein [Chloroflexota bacterium]MDA1147293.1 ClbS/DfsB family four-helix bundle protein [Chloroflexota bacterium]
MVADDPDAPISTAECLARFRAARARVDQRCAELRSWTAESAEGWTAKDYLAHLTAWQRRMVRWFAEGAAGTSRSGPEAGYTFEQLDALNERDFLGSRDAPLAQVRREFEETADAVEALVESLDDADLNDAARVPWLGFEARHTIAGNTYGHYLEHLEALEGLVAGKGTA